MAYVRRDKQRTSAGEERVYLSIAHNLKERIEGKKPRSKPKIIANLGREDALDQTMVNSIVDALSRYQQARFGAGHTGAEVASGLAQAVKGSERALRVMASRAFGMRVIIEKVWQDLGLQSLLSKLKRQHKLVVDLERVVFAMVLHRLIDPGSKMACNDWVADEAWFPEAEEWQVQHFYRALDVLEQHAEELTKALVSMCADAPQDPDDLVLRLIDTTSTYFETDEEDTASNADAEAPLRQRGKSKDHRPDKPQVVVGMVCDHQGQPVAHKVFPGHTNDQQLTRVMTQVALSTCPQGRIVVCCDSGMGSQKNLKQLDAQGLDRVSGVPLRVVKKAEEMLCKPGRWRKHPDKAGVVCRVLDVSAADTKTGRAEVWVATRNQKEQKRVLARLKRQEARVRAALAKDKRCDAHGKPMCKVLSSRSLGRFVGKTKTGRLCLDRQRLALERRRAGVKVIRSTLTDLSPMVTVRVYQRLLEVETGFRDLKGPIQLRPMYHRKPSRIRAHIFVCMMALRVLRSLELRTGQTLRALKKLFEPQRATLLQGKDQTHWQRMPWSDNAQQVLQQLGCAPTPTVWGQQHLEGGSKPN